MNKLNMNFTKEQIEKINQIGSFLAIRDNIPKKVDVLILLGSSLISHLELISDMYHLGQFDELFIVGGIGHSTNYLYDNINAYAPFRIYLDTSLSEAELYHKILHEYYNIPDNIITIETSSTNCGNNASYAFEMASHREVEYKNVLLIQDPTMQKRSYASFLKEWKKEYVSFYNYAPFLPKLALDSKGDIYFLKPKNPPWTVERYIELIMGEIPRLRDDKNGYGPKGENFITHVDIPIEIENAYQFLVNSLMKANLERI